MKKILFVSSFEGVGGTEKSLLRFFKSLQPNIYVIDLVLIGGEGPLVEEIPEWINIYKIRALSGKKYITSALKKGKILKASYGCLCSLKLKKNWIESHIDTMYQYEHSLYLYPKIGNEYDVAVTWYVPNAVHTAFTIKNVNAKRKIMWIHMDIKKDYMPQDSGNILEQYDKIYCVSKACKKSFDEKFANCSKKTEVFYNIIDIQELKKMGNDVVDKIAISKFKIVTCGRIVPEKQPLFAIDIIEKLVESGYTNVVWYFIGDGELYEPMVEELEKRNLNDYFIFVGRVNNPYAYVSKCDLYVQMSLHESYCLTLAEAQLLGIPAVSTDFPSAYEIIDNDNTGFIVKNSWIDIEKTIKYVIDNREVLLNMREKLKRYKLYSLGNIKKFLGYVDMESNI